MPREVSHSVEIAAAGHTVWSILTDFSAMSAWNPFIRRHADAVHTRRDVLGLLVPLAREALLRSTRAGFAEMNEALKLRAEAAQTGAA